MYQIQDLGENTRMDQWEVRKNDKTVFRGSFKDTLRYTVHELGFNLVDFEKAVTAIIYNGHNTLHFHAGKRLSSTSYIPTRKMQRTG